MKEETSVKGEEAGRIKDQSKEIIKPGSANRALLRHDWERLRQ
jgi:hypothetical protein